MDFDKPKVYGDTFISDGLVIMILLYVCENDIDSIIEFTRGRI